MNAIQPFVIAISKSRRENRRVYSKMVFAGIELAENSEDACKQAETRWPKQSLTVFCWGMVSPEMRITAIEAELGRPPAIHI